MKMSKEEIEKERRELKEEIFDLKHPRNEKGQFQSKATVDDTLRFWKKKWGPKYGLGESETRLKE
jgi:hypothetical protein|tara:strand:- start:136 stop:330 length:195 start_codon:yes stop_codon:yes gene_type:complete